MKKNKTQFTNIRFASFRTCETLEERDRRICEANDEPYEPSELTETVKQYTVNGMVNTDFASLTMLAKELDDCWGYSLIIGPTGNLVIYEEG